MVPQVVGGAVIDSVQNGEGICLEGVDGAFGYIPVMDICQDKLEGTVALVKDGATILDSSFIVKDLEINSVALGFEARHDDVVGRNVIPVIE